MKIRLNHTYEDIISVENSLAAWQEFILGKRGRSDVQEFSLHLIDNILQLHAELANGTYRHGSYERFNISDPKPRIIHKASVRDRLLHHAVYRVLYPFFDRTFIADSYSCRLNKGTHKAMTRFQRMAWQVSKNNTKTCWVLKCDIRKFFASIDQEILMNIVHRHIPDQQILNLSRNIIMSFSTAPGKGLPLGNLTSQLFANVYLNRLDQFVKHVLKVPFYVRYADDFVVLSVDQRQLETLVPVVWDFLQTELHLSLHPDKVFIKTLASGVDFLGWVHWPNHRVLRTTTKRRMLRRIQEHAIPETLQSYLGLLRHGDTYLTRRQALNTYAIWKEG